ncbi:MAG TPA: cytochrome b/b6 domain-containing protein [Ilumatobacteraceae bacterium]
MTPPVDAAAGPRARRPAKPVVRIQRFARAERFVHRSLAVLMMTCIVTAAILYNGSLSVPIGHRRIVKTIHVFSGFALPIPIILGMLSAAYRADIGRLNRFSPSDWKWLRSRKRRDGTIPVGKFNAGQKLNSALSTGAIFVLLATGTLMYFPDIARLSWRTGSTFVHDWFALAVGLLILGHISYAVRDNDSRHGMRHGDVPLSWAEDKHHEWAAEMKAGLPAPAASDE